MSSKVRVDRCGCSRRYTSHSLDGGIIQLIMGLRKPSREEKILRSILYGDRRGRER
jgi:hypothetical protein